MENWTSHVEGNKPKIDTDSISVNLRVAGCVSALFQAQTHKLLSDVGGEVGGRENGGTVCCHRLARFLGPNEAIKK